MEYRALGNTGIKLSALSMGASSLGGVFHAIDQAEGIRAVHMALDAGINHFDVAPAYGATVAETVLGQALRGVARNRYVLSTKVGQYDKYGVDFSADGVRAKLHESMHRLGVEYVDIVYCHDIEYVDIDVVIHETLPALRQAQREGLIRYVGISGYPLAIYPRVLAAYELDVVLSYCHLMLGNTRVLELVPQLQARGVGIINAAPLGMGLLTQQGPPEWHPAPAYIRARYAEAAAFCQAQGVDIAQLAMQYSVAHPQVATTLVSTASPAHVAANLAWMAQPIDAHMVAEVLRILAPVCNESWQTGRAENN
jgi:aryl-alcohol dehydrogenase-like predicted oxidoreductase